MKYILICLAVAALCCGLGFLTALLIQKKMKAKFSRPGVILTAAGSSIAVLAVLFIVYFGIYYHAGDKALSALNGSATVTVRKIDGGYLFDGPSEDRAVIFYPGAKVEAEAYAPLMLKLAENGTDCFLAEMPLHFVLFGSNAADKFIRNYNYEQWILAGHSLGGVAASGYAAEHADTVGGIVLLAAYTTVPIGDETGVCLIRGSEDGCLDLEQYTANRVNLPAGAEEFLIDGGNHAQFGDYGLQKGDGTAAITADDQQKRTADAITEYFSR